MAKVGIDLKDISQIIPKKQKISSRNKGKSGEYFFANFLTELTGKKFMKVPNSGAILGASNQQKVLQLTAGVANVFLGDLIPPADFKHKHILECKNYAKFAFDKLKKQKTIILISHDVGFVPSISTSVFCVNRSLQIHTVDKLTDFHPVNFYNCDIRIVDHTTHKE